MIYIIIFSYNKYKILSSKNLSVWYVNKSLYEILKLSQMVQTEKSKYLYVWYVNKSLYEILKLSQMVQTENKQPVQLIITPLAKTIEIDKLLK